MLTPRGQEVGRGGGGEADVGNLMSVDNL